MENGLKRMHKRVTTPMLHQPVLTCTLMCSRR
jgi:hypothetical protein